MDMRQNELNHWQRRNFGVQQVTDMVLGMTEEVGELAHWIMKRKQGIREAASGGDFKEEIGNAFADVVIYGIQAMTYEGIDAEAVLTKTIEEVLKRDFVNNPSGQGYRKPGKLLSEEEIIEITGHVPFGSAYSAGPDEVAFSRNNVMKLLQAQLDLRGSDAN